MPPALFPDNPWAASFTAVAIVSALPLLVTLLIARRDALLRRILPSLSAFGAGAVFAAAAGHLIPEAIGAGHSIASVAIGVVAGYGLFWGIERLLAGHDHAHAHGMALGAPSAHESDAGEQACMHLAVQSAVIAPSVATHGARGTGPQGALALQPGSLHVHPLHVHPLHVHPLHVHQLHAQPNAQPIHAHPLHAHPLHTSLAPMTFIGDALHNMVDGMLIAAGFLTDPSVGMLTLVAVALHELPRELGTFGLLVQGGLHPMRAVGYNLVTAVLAMVGAALTLLVGTTVSTVAMYMLPVAAGTYLYIALIVARSSLKDRHASPAQWKRLGWSGLGIAVTLSGHLFAH